MNKEKELLFNIKFNELTNIKYIYENVLINIINNEYYYYNKYFFSKKLKNNIYHIFFEKIFNIYNYTNNHKLNLLNEQLLIIDISKYKYYHNKYLYIDNHNNFDKNYYIDLKYFKLIYKYNLDMYKIIINNNFNIYYYNESIQKIKKKYNDFIIEKIYKNWYTYINKYIKIKNKNITYNKFKNKKNIFKIYNNFSIKKILFLDDKYWFTHRIITDNNNIYFKYYFDICLIQRKLYKYYKKGNLYNSSDWNKTPSIKFINNNKIKTLI